MSTRDHLLDVAVGPIAETWGKILETSSEIAFFLTAAQRQELVRLFLAATFEQSGVKSSGPTAAFLRTPAVASFQHSLSNLREQTTIDQFHTAVSTLQWSVRQYLVSGEISPDEALSLYEAVNQILDAVMRETTEEWAFQQFEIRKLKDELEGLYRIASHATVQTDLEDVLNTVVAEISELLAVDFVALLLPPEDLSGSAAAATPMPPDAASVRALEIMAMVASQQTRELLDRMVFAIDEGGAIARAYVSGEVIVSSAPVDDLHVTIRRRQSLETLGFRHLMAAPIKIFNFILGVACVANRDEHRRFGTETAHLLTTVCAQAAAAIRNKQLFAKNKALSMDLVFTLAQALDARDTYTHNHSANVAALARRIALEMGLASDQAEDIFVAGLLHDIGKIGIADAVLHKPGTLNRAERSLMMQHPVKSAQILQPVRGMQHLIPAVRHHHERWDGNGYPDGLSADEIPLGARILALADAYDVMNNHRIYRRRRSPDDLLTELREMGGKQFDPELVEILLRLAASDGPNRLTSRTRSVIPDPGAYYADGDHSEGDYLATELEAIARLLDSFSKAYDLPIRLQDASGRTVAGQLGVSGEAGLELREVAVKVSDKTVGRLSAPSRIATDALEELASAIEGILNSHGTLSSQIKQFGELADLVNQLNACCAPEEVLPIAVRAAKRMIGSDFATIWLAEDDRTLRFAASAGRAKIPWDTRITLGHEDGLEGYVAYRKIPTAAVDYLAEERFRVPDWVRQEGMASALALPIMMGMRLVGVLSVMTYQTVCFANEDTSILSAIASAAAASYENALLRRLQLRSAHD